MGQTGATPEGPAMSGTLANIALIIAFILVGSLFAAAEIALVSLRESQVRAMAGRGRRGQAVARLSSDPNRFLAAVQVGVTLAGFLSAAFGGATLSGKLSPELEKLGVGPGLADAVALVLVTLAISYVSLVFGELSPKRLALQRAEVVRAGRSGRPSTGSRRSVRPVIWLLSASTDVVVRLVGGDPKAQREQMSDEELRELVEHPRDAGGRGAPDRRGRLRGRRPADPRGDGAAHRGRLHRRLDAGGQGRPRRRQPAALALPGDPRLRRRRDRVRARPRPLRAGPDGPRPAGR